MGKVYFVSGIDTDAGKSFVTGHLAKVDRDRGLDAMTMKFIQTGGVAESGYSIDIQIHREIMGIEFTQDDKDCVTAPVIFSYPASPHLAAEIDGETIDFDAIDKSIATLSAKHDILYVEGAGGLYVPLTRSYSTMDYIAERGFELILATGGKLGSINHTILSLEACKNRGVKVAKVIYNRYFGADDRVIDNDTFGYLKDIIEKEYKGVLFEEF